MVVPSSQLDQHHLSYLIQSGLQEGQLLLLDDQRGVVQILDDEIVPLGIDLQDDGFDGGITFHKNPCEMLVCELVEMRVKGYGYLGQLWALLRRLAVV